WIEGQQRLGAGLAGAGGDDGVVNLAAGDGPAGGAAEELEILGRVKGDDVSAGDEAQIEELEGIDWPKAVRRWPPRHDQVGLDEGGCGQRQPFAAIETAVDLLDGGRVARVPSGDRGDDAGRIGQKASHRDGGT